MSILQGATNVAILGGTHVAAGAGSSINVYHAPQLGASSAFKDLSAAAAHTALHDSAARFDAPRCHRNTRAKYRDSLELWMLGQGEEFKGKQLIWLHGGAGAGKSAIMQSVVEQCAEHGAVLGSFFFSRADSSRNYAEVLIPTLAYQLARSFPAAMAVLEPVIHRDPLVFKSSLQTQAYELLVRPILYLFENGIIDNTSLLRRVFVIDGLDECSDPKKQALIIRVISSILTDHGVPVNFMIASRPEMAISSAFEKEKKVYEIFSTITLDNDDDAESDIRQFVEDGFLDIIDNHPMRQYINLPWPDRHSIDNLALKSSGHFVYAATVMKFLASDDEHPGRALQVVEGLQSSRTGSPFAELDALYMHILTSARYSKQVLEILRHLYLSPLSNTVAIICYVHNISPQDVSLFLSDVRSLVSLAPNSFAELSIIAKHASLSNFLEDEERSQMLYISKEVYRANLVARHFQLLDSGPKTSSFCFWHDDGLYFRPGSNGYPRYNDVSGLIVGLTDGLVHSKDTNLLQSLVSRHAPHDIWNFCVESFVHDTTVSSTEARIFLAQEIGDYLCAVRDSIGLCDDALYVDQFKMLIELLLDDLNDFLHRKPQYRIIPALIFLGGPSGLHAAHNLLSWWGRQFHINESYHYFLWHFLMNRDTFKTDPRSFKALKCSPQRQLSWGPDLAVAMDLVLRHLVSLPWPGPSDTLYTSPHKRWLQRRKPLKRVSLGSPKLSSTLVLSILGHDKDGTPYRWGFNPEAHFLLSCWRNFRSRNRGLKIDGQRKKCITLLETIVCYLRKSDYTSEVLRLAKKSLPMSAQWSPRLMKRARYEMDAYVRRWEGPSDRVLKKAKLLPTD